ncbi:recombinase RecT [Agrobacterium sp. CMT1]|uniref:recombinase RecT n=1 Tax=Agrobacterium sp. CMT1 TaxID=3128901 RepID=UPI003076E8E0
MNAVAKTEAAPRTSLIATMAAKYQMDADQFAKTVRATVMPAQHTNEQFAALMLVANEYDLNPVVKEIYAFPAKGGGIVPIVSIDGWVNLVNSHPACDGFEFEFEHDDQKKLVSCTCRMYRKDRGRPVTVTEYLAECKRNTDPWKMEHRMLRHKAMIQAARYAFGFSGIYDEDEGSKIAEMRDVTPPKPPQPPEPPTDEVSGDGSDILDLTPEKPSEDKHGEINADEFIDLIKGELGTAQSVEDLEEVWTARDPMAALEGDDVRQGLAVALKNKNLKRLGASS